MDIMFYGDDALFKFNADIKLVLMTSHVHPVCVRIL